MEELYLNLSDATQMINFLSHWLALASNEYKKHAESYIKDYDDGKEVDLVLLQNFVREFARDIYPARYALNVFFNNEGSALEWSRIAKAVRRSTAHLMERYKSSGEAETVEQMFLDDDFDITFSEDEVSEIRQVRHQLREEYWLTNKAALTKLIDDGESELKKFEEAIAKLRDCAGGLPTLLQEELYSKITRFEDRVYFNGEDMDDQVLQEELNYYQDQKEIPIGA